MPQTGACHDDTVLTIQLFRAVTRVALDGSSCLCYRSAIVASVENHLIERLKPADRKRLLGVCQSIPLTLSEVMAEPGEPLRYVYFPVEGFISLVAMVTRSPGVEVGMVGREGMLGAHLALGVATSPLHALVQGAGTAWRVSASDFKTELARSSSLQQVVKLYLYVLMSQLASSVACLRFHKIQPRLARWLLMSQDRAHSERFRVTQEFLSLMLGVRRVGITTAAGALQRAGLIEYHRGEITVLNRGGLEAAACSCFATDSAAYAKLL